MRVVGPAGREDGEAEGERREGGAGAAGPERRQEGVGQEEREEELEGGGHRQGPDRRQGEREESEGRERRRLGVAEERLAGAELAGPERRREAQQPVPDQGADGIEDVFEVGVVHRGIESFHTWPACSERSPRGPRRPPPRR